MAPYRILTPTLGHVETIEVLEQGGVRTRAPLIAWSWWCRGWLRRVWLVAAHRAAAEVLDYEMKLAESRREPRWDDRRKTNQPPQAYAVEVSVAMGYGLPDEWRGVRYRDAIYAARYASWRQGDPKERGPAPVWGGRPNLRRVA